MAGGRRQVNSVGRDINKMMERERERKLVSVGVINRKIKREEMEIVRLID